MNTFVAFALLCCVLPTVNCLFGKLLTLTTEPDDFCDEGPPGRYCLMDLSGWHDCHVDPDTGKMVDTIHNCPSNTRCACFYGPSCPGYLDDPCQPFRPPPPPPDKFTLYYNAYQRQCSPTGCVDSYYSGREIQSLTEFKKRDDSYEKYWATTFVLPGGNGSSFVQTNVRWDEQICQSDQIKAFPETSVPPYFSFNGKVKVGYRLCDKWIWRTGGHNPGQATSLTAYYIANKTIDASGANKDPYVSVMDPVKYEIMFNSGPVGKTSMYLVFNITSFLAGKADEEQLKLPDFCKT